MAIVACAQAKLKRRFRVSLETWEHLAGAVESVLTSIAIMIGGMWTYAFFIRRRQRWPHAEITHNLSSRRVPSGKLLLSTDLYLKNIGQEALRVAVWKIDIRQALPPSSEMKFFIEQNMNTPALISEWQEVAVYEERRRDRNALIILESGKQEQFHYDFLVMTDATTVFFESYVENSAEYNRPIGWHLTTIHDLSPPEEDANAMGSDSAAA